MQANQHFIYNLYRPIFIVMLICGYNFGLPKHPVTKIAFYIYALTLIFVISYSNMTCCRDQQVAFIWSLFEYIVFVLVMLIYKTKVRVFLQKLMCLDTYLRVNRRHYYCVRKKILLGIIGVWLMGVIYVLVACFKYSSYFIKPSFFIYELSTLALDVNRVWRYFLFEEIWRRLRILRLRMEENPDADFYLYVKNNMMVKENKLKFCLGLYRSIADLLELIAPELNVSLIVSIVCCIPKLIINVYRLLLVIDNLLPIENAGFMIMHIVQTSIFIFSPCVIVELYGCEVERIRKFLMHKLMREKDPEVKSDLQLFLQYTKLRSFRYRVWRAVPLDLSLPLNILNICTTYVIVVVNFTKVFQT